MGQGLGSVHGATMGANGSTGTGAGLTAATLVSGVSHGALLASLDLTGSFALAGLDREDVLAGRFGFAAVAAPAFPPESVVATFPWADREGVACWVAALAGRAARLAARRSEENRLAM